MADYIYGQPDAADESNPYGKPAPKPSGALRKAVGDKVVGFASGAVGATKAIADAVGAGNVVSNTLDNANKGVNDYLSPEAKADQQAHSARSEQAKGTGAWNEFKAGVQNFAESPIQQTVTGVGSIAPVALAALGGLPAAAATGIAMGAGTVKGRIYDDTKKRGIDAGLSAADADAAATKAQNYTGENTDQIALGGALGAADALTGAGRVAGGMLRNAVMKPAISAIPKAVERGIVGRAAMGALVEFPLEAAQGGQEQLATNIAAQRQGVNVDTWSGVAGQATEEGLASLGSGAAFGVARGRNANTAPPGVVPPPAVPPAPPLQIGNTPDPYISFPDGTVARRSEADAYVNSLPADQQPAARAKLMGLAPQPAKPSEQMGLTPTAGPSLTNAAITAVDSGAAQVNIDQAPAEQTDIVEQQRQQYQQETAALLAQQDQEAFDAYLAAIEDANTALDEAPGESVQALSQLDDISVPDIFDANSNTSDADFLRAMGATEQEIEDAITNQPGSPQAGTPNPVGTAQDEPGSTGQSVSADQTKQANLERIRKANNVSPPDSVQPIPATSSGQDGNQPAASVGLGSTDGNGLGANAAGSESGAVGQSGEQASGALRTPVAQGRQQPTTLGTQTSANAGPGFSAKDVQGVKNQSPAATDPQAGQAPVEAPQAVAGDAAPASGVPAAGSAAVEGDGVEPKAKWLKAINDQNRLAGDTGVQLKVVDGKLTFYGDPKSTKQGRALEATLAEARKAGATQQEIIGSISQPAATNPAAGVGPASLGSVKADMDHLFGIDQKRAKALDRIAAGKAWWTKPLDAQEFITKNGLKDTHQSVKEGGKWYVRAKAVSQPTKSTNEKATEAQPQQAKPKAGTTAGVQQPTASSAVAGEAEGVSRSILNTNGPHFASGVSDFKAGKPRVLPSYFTKATGKNPKDWYRGWDAANAAAPVASSSPEAVSAQGEGLNDHIRALRAVAHNGIKQGGPKGDVRLNMRGSNLYVPFDVAVAEARKAVAAGMKPVPFQVSSTLDIGIGETDRVIAALSKPEIVVDKAEMRPYRKPDGSVGYEAVPIQEATPAADTPKTDAKAVLSEREKAAKAKMFNALGKLATLAGKNTRMNWTQEEEQQLLPIVIELFDGAMELGAVTFQQAVAYVREFISSNLDQDTADSIPFDTLQGAYISVAGRHKDKPVTSKKEVVGYESLEELTAELEKTAEKADTSIEDKPNDSGTEKQSGGALDGVSPAEVGGPGSGGSSGRGAKSSSTRRRKGNSSTDGNGRAPGRSGGDSATDADSSSTGGTGRGRGIKGNGSGVSADGGTPDVKLDAGSGRGVPKGQDGLFTEAGEVVPAAVPAANFIITPDLKLGSGGEVTKYKDNIAAIRVLKLIESEHRRATAEEQRVLARYVGWGGLANAFRNRVTGAVKADWANEVAELESLLTAKELKAASASTPNAHYTSETVTGFMWRAAVRMGYSGGMALESSVGSGNFIGLMPENARRGTFMTGIELDSITARIAGALYPQANIVHSAFEKVALPDNTFDLNIGNPPFGQVSLRMQYNPKHNGKSIHNQFFLGGMDALRPGGLQAMVVSRYLMDAQDASTREALALKAELLGAIRLPGSAFKGNAGTDVVTDILFLKKRSTAEQTELQDLWNSRGAKVPAKESYADRAARLAGQARLLQALDWTTTAKVPDPLGGEAMQISKYFADNPQMVAGVMDRSGSMQFGGDIDVKLPASELAAKLDSLMAFLPGVKGEFRSDEVNAKTEEMHRALGESMSIMASGREIGSIYYDESGALTEIVERVGVDGKTIVSKNTIDASTPWSSQLSMNMEGKWFKEVAQLDEKGEKVKTNVKINLKTGKKTGRNVYVREVFANESDVPSGMRLGVDGFAKLQKLVAIRELYVEQINLETNSAQPEPMEANRAKLRAAYEAFVADHGYISEQKNAAIISEMPDEGLMLSLELKFRPAVTLPAAVKRGIKPSPARAEQNAILTRAVAIPPERKNAASSVSDAVAIVLGESGRIDVARVAELRSITEDEALAELIEGDSPMAYMDPETNEVTEKNQYLSGNVRKKMTAARDAGLKRNVDALMKVQPEPWTSDKVTAHIGASWVPPEVYANFVKSLLGREATVSFSQLSNTFEVYAPGSTAIDTSKWGTGRLPAVELLNDILNSRRIAIYDGGYKDVPRVLNETETQSAIDKKKEIIEEFDNWIFKDGDRRQELTRLFNDKYNILVNRQYDGSHMDFPGKVPDSIIAFRRNQINAIWRGIVDRFTMYDHAVGAGKTFTGIARAMERKRMGLSNKPTIVVPNHLVSEWATQAYRLYPGAKILAAGAKDLEPKNRRRLFAKIAAGDWDLVIVPHSSFKFIGISPETEERFINDELRVAQDALKEAEDDAEPGQRFKPLSVKAAEALILKLENRMDVVRGKAGKDQLLTFEQMGIDDLTVDESHEFKNLTYSTKLTDVRGLGPAAGSQKAFDLYTKMRILHETNGSAVFLTGTPISNSAVEMYTIMRYLAPDVLRESGLEHFDAFRAQYVQATEKPEPTEAGDGLKVVNRLGRNWSNMRSLMDGYYSVADVVTNDDIKAWYAEDNPGKVFPLPNVKGGSRRSVVAKPTATQQRLIDELIAGYNNLPNIEDVRQRNIDRLKLMDKARKLALHAKVWDRSLTDEPGGKLDMVVDESFRLYKAFEANKGTQLIFLDRSVPKAQGDDKQIKDYDALRAKLTEANANGDEDGQREAIEALEKFDSQEIDELRSAQAGGWNAYQHMADGLIAKGVPKNQIAFIQNFTTDAQKKALFEAVNDGTIRFLFGSSQRMGAGMNVQERLVGLHHVDVTWKPSDIEQREGRIIRQGNLFFTEMVDSKPNPMYDPKFEVEIMAYVTERSIDAKMWDLNSTKLRMVNGIRYYDGEFEMDFDDDAAIDMAEIAAIASGDPLMLERIKVNTVIEELYRKRRSYNRRVESAGDSLRSAERDVETLPGKIAKTKALMGPIDKAIKEAKADQYARRVTVGGESFMFVETALKHAEEAIKVLKEGDSKKPFALDVDGESFTSEAGVQDAIAEKMGDVNSFVAEIDGKKVIRRTAVARELRRLIGTEFADVETTPVGTLFGFPFSMKAEKGPFGAYVTLTAKVPYEGGVEPISISYDLTPEKHKKGTPVPVLTSTLRAAVDSLVGKLDAASNDTYWLERMQRDLKEATANIPTYREAAKEQFKQADELDAALTRLDDIQDQLQARAAAASAAPVATPVTPNDGAVFSQGLLSPASLGPKPTLDQIQRLVDKVLKVAKNVIPVTVIGNPSQVPGVRVPVGSKPTGALIDGRIYLFADNIQSIGDAYVTLFHELFHLGLQKVIPAEDYATLLRQFSRNLLVQKFVREWKASPEGVEKAGTMNSAAYDALAAEEALAMVSEELSISNGIGTNRTPGLVKAMLSWIAEVVDKMGFPASFGKWIRGLTQTEAERFVSQMVSAAMGGDKNLGRTQSKYGTLDAKMTAQTRLSDGNAQSSGIRFRSLDSALTQAANSVRDVNLPAGYKVGDLFNAVPGKLNWWYRTLGTQYNLAQRSPAFKRVYDAVQTFINDVSYFATEAADMAPNILPKLESWKDLAKSPLSAADTKALSAPVFEGTLIWARDESGKAVKMETLEAKAKTMTPEQKAQRLLRGDHISEQMLKTWKGLPIDQYERLVNDKYEDSMLKAGIVFKDAELTALFGLSDKQIALYREFRKATDKSLANLAIADMLRFGGKDADPVRDVVLESKSVKDAADTLSKYLRSLADLDPDRATVLMDTANKMIDKGDKAQGLMDRGYAPLSRFGSYTLDVVDANGERAYFGMFESAAEASRMRRKMEGLYPGSRITQGTVSEQAYKMFAGVSPETLELFGDMLGLETQGDDTASQAFQEYLKLAKSSRSAMKRLIQRKGIAGFSEDAGRVLAGFVYSNARQTATSLHMGEMTQAAADNDAFRNQGETQDAAVKLVDYIKNPQEEAQKLRGLLFAQYIGGSVASAMVNMTQPITMTFPWLSQYGGVASAAKQMTAAIKDVGKPSTGDTKLDAALRKAEEDGTVSPQEVHQLLKQSQGRSALQSDDGTRAGYAMALAQNTVSRFSLVWGKLFSVAEQFNRRVTFIAAYRTAVAQGMADPDEFARKAISETQGVYNKGNKPAWARGAVGSTLFTFKQYSIAYVEMLSRMAKSGPEGKKAALLALAVLFLLSGAGGMPGADDLDDVISGAMQAMGYNFDSKMKRKEFFVSLLGEGGAQFVERGVSGLPGVPLDVSGRMGLGNLIPGTGLLTKKADHTRDVAEIAGPAGDFVKRGFDAAGKLITGNVAGAVNSIAPKAIQNITQAFDMANMGMYRDTKGMKVLDTDMGDAVVKAIGFQPNDVKRAQDANSEVARMIGLNKIVETEIANRWAIGIFEKDTDKVQAARDDLAGWNRSNPESPIRINFTQIRSRVQKMNQTKAERIAKTAPREIRAAVRKELADAR